MLKAEHDPTLGDTYHKVDTTRPSVCRFDVGVRVLRIRQVVQRTNLSRSTIYSLISSDPSFPSKVRLSERAIGFLEHEIDAWILARSEKRGDGCTLEK